MQLRNELQDWCDASVEMAELPRNRYRQRRTESTWRSYQDISESFHNPRKALEMQRLSLSLVRPQKNRLDDRPTPHIVNRLLIELTGVECYDFLDR